MRGYRPEEDRADAAGEPALEYFGYGNRWFDRLGARQRRGAVIVAAFGLLAFCCVLLRWAAR